jgi:hypothetical protein
VSYQCRMVGKPPRVKTRRMKIGFCVLAMCWAWPAAADPLLDFSVFSPPDYAQRRLPEPTVSWLVHPQASERCQSAEPKDGFVRREEGCVYWQLSTSQCTIVTTGQTTHSLLGHLFIHCLQGK